MTACFLYPPKTIRLQNIKISLASIKDVNQIADVAKKTYMQMAESYERSDRDPGDREKLVELRFGKEFRGEIFPEEIISKKVLYFIVKDEASQKIAGYAKILFNLSEIATLDKIYLLKDYQGKMIGSALLRACLNHALAYGYNKIELATNTKNKKAIDFYRKHGFVETGKTFSPDIPNSNGSKITDQVMLCNDIAQCLRIDKQFNPIAKM